MMKNLNHNKLFKRYDVCDKKELLPSSYEVKENNQMNDYAVYLRIEDSVVRLHFVNYDSGNISYNCMTSLDNSPSYDEMAEAFKVILTPEINYKYSIPVIINYR